MEPVGNGAVTTVPLACPACLGGLDAGGPSGSASCGSCGVVYPARPAGGHDLRPRLPVHRTVRQQVPAVGTADGWHSSLADGLAAGDGAALPGTSSPYLTHGNRLTPNLVTRLGVRPGSRLLDLGCGEENALRPLVEGAGGLLVGVDYEGDGPDHLADAHCLPFPDDAFDGVVSLAVLEHVTNPYLVVQEVSRVLRPGGVFVGTVAFLEPFHLESVFHHTARGTWSVLHEAGFENIEIEPNREWDVVRATIEMGLLRGVPPSISRRIAAWASAAVRLQWRASRRGASLDQVSSFTGGFRFVAW